MQSFRRKIRVSIGIQRLDLLEIDAENSEQVLSTFPVSTSGFGVGSEPGSNKTPLGRFVIGEKIGQGEPLGAVFVGRVPTGEISPFESPDDPADRITTRILWLEGREPHNSNTRDRYIYIHGTNHEERLGEACSHGCVRMSNADVAHLFDLVEPGSEVCIEA